jgi:hypothetical protein
MTDGLATTTETTTQITVDVAHISLQSATMEDFFAPTTRLRDLYRASREGAYADEEEEEARDALVELELITGSSAVLLVTLFTGVN